MIDIRKKLQDTANKIVNESMTKSSTPLTPYMEEFLKDLVGLSLQKGFIFGVKSIQQTTEVLLKDVKDE